MDKQYQQCNDATVLTIVRGPVGYSFPGFIKFDGECYENPQTTSSVSHFN